MKPFEPFEALAPDCSRNMGARASLPKSLRFPELHSGDSNVGDPDKSFFMFPQRLFMYVYIYNIILSYIILSYIILYIIFGIFWMLWRMLKEFRPLARDSMQCFSDQCSLICIHGIFYLLGSLIAPPSLCSSSAEWPRLQSRPLFCFSSLKVASAHLG